MWEIVSNSTDDSERRAKYWETNLQKRKHMLKGTRWIKESHWNLNPGPFSIPLFGPMLHRGAGAGPAGMASVGPMLEAKLMNLIKGQLQKFWLSNNFSVKFTRGHVPTASPDQSWYASDATVTY